MNELEQCLERGEFPIFVGNSVSSTRSVRVVGMVINYPFT